MNKILIIGSGGAGKSTAAIKLAKITNLPLIHLDQQYWGPNWQATPQKQWEQKLLKLLSKPQWIMDGNYDRTMNLRFKYADTIIFLHYSTLNCIIGSIKRIITQKRPDPIKKCNEQFNWAFFKFIYNYNTKRAPTVLKKLSKLKDKKIYIIKNRTELDQFFNNLN